MHGFTYTVHLTSATARWLLGEREKNGDQGK